MEIKGRECEETKIGEHNYFFLKEFKGREFRLIQGIVYKQNDGTKIDTGAFLANIPELFEVLCTKVDDNENVLGGEFLDNLSIEDYGKVQAKVIEVVTDFFTQIK